MTELTLEPETDVILGSPIDQLEKEMFEAGQTVALPLVHRFTPGLYIREIFIPKGTLLTTVEHDVKHPFIISQGCVSVWSDNEGEVIYEAPYTGITTPGTRRIVYAHEDTIWTTIHPTDLKDPDEIVRSVTKPHNNPLLIEHNDDPRLNLWKSTVSPSLYPADANPQLVEATKQ